MQQVVSYQVKCKPLQNSTSFVTRKILRRPLNLGFGLWQRLHATGAVSDRIAIHKCNLFFNYDEHHSNLDVCHSRDDEVQLL